MKAVSWVLFLCFCLCVFSLLGLAFQVSPQVNLQLLEQTFTEAVWMPWTLTFVFPLRECVGFVFFLYFFLFFNHSHKIRTDFQNKGNLIGTDFPNLVSSEITHLEQNKICLKRSYFRVSIRRGLYFKKIRELFLTLKANHSWKPGGGGEWYLVI